MRHILGLLTSVQGVLEILINCCPSGETRDKMTELNIELGLMLNRYK